MVIQAGGLIFFAPGCSVNYRTSGITGLYPLNASPPFLLCKPRKKHTWISKMSSMGKDSLFWRLLTTEKDQHSFFTSLPLGARGC
jgi:hypothetical protein